MEKSYWKTDRIIGAKLDRLNIALTTNTIMIEYSDSTEEEKVESCLAIYFLILRILLSFEFLPSALSNKNDIIHAIK